MQKKPVPNYGPGSISTTAKAKREIIDARIVAATGPSLKDRLLDAITRPSSGPMSQSSKAIQDRIAQEKALKREAGGRK